MIRVKGAFATRWREEWKTAGDLTRHGYSSGEYQQQVEYFLEAMKYDITEVLLENLDAKRHSSSQARPLPRGAA
jgi:hypothetical protein